MLTFCQDRLDLNLGVVIVAPVVDDGAWHPLASDKDRLVLGDDLAFGKKKESLGVDL